jgi:hypothetical protein
LTIKESSRSTPNLIRACLIKEDTMKTRSWFGAILCAISACLLLVSPMAVAGKAAAHKLEGAWVAKVQGFPGQWSYVLAADSSGRRASGHGSVDLGFDADSAFGCSLGESDVDTPILVNIEMTGPDTAVAYSIWYGLKTSESGPTEIVFIGEVKSEITFIALGKGVAVHYFAFYLPSQDVEPEDGFPDEGETPACVAPVAIYTVDTRLPAP